MHPNAAERQEIGRWLAGLFLAEVTRDTLAFYRSVDGQQVLDSLEQVSALAGLVAALRGLAERRDALETIRLDLAAAYGQMFLTGGPKSVPLHASAYLGQGGRLMQAPVHDTETILRSLGLSVPPGFREPADHLGVQLSILAELAGSERSDLPGEIAYCDTRLLTWVPDLAAQCSKVATQPLYRELGTATLGWLRCLETSVAAETPVA